MIVLRRAAGLLRTWFFFCLPHLMTVNNTPFLSPDFASFLRPLGAFFQLAPEFRRPRPWKFQKILKENVLTARPPGIITMSPTGRWWSHQLMKYLTPSKCLNYFQFSGTFHFSWILQSNGPQRHQNEWNQLVEPVKWSVMKMIWRWRWKWNWRQWWWLRIHQINWTLIALLYVKS